VQILRRNVQHSLFRHAARRLCLRASRSQWRPTYPGLSSPVASPIRPPAVAATEDGAAGMRMRKVSGMLLSCKAAPVRGPPCARRATLSGAWPVVRRGNSRRAGRCVQLVIIPAHVPEERQQLPKGSLVIDPARSFYAVRHALMQTRQTPFRESDANYRDFEVPSVHHCIERREDHLVGEVARHAEEHQRVRTGGSHLITPGIYFLTATELGDVAIEDHVWHQLYYLCSSSAGAPKTSI